MSAVHVNPYSSTHTVAHVTTNMLNFLKEIIRESGLDPSHLMDEWESLELAINTWLSSRHLTTVILEIYNPKTDKLVKPRWDLDVIYDYAGDTLWADGNAVRYHIQKAGLVPSSCKYRFVCNNKDGRPDVPGWSKTQLRSIEGLKKHSIGAAIGGTNIARHRLLEVGMLTVTEAFRKFRSKLELTEKESKDAARRQNEIRGVMDEAFNLETDFLTGSYKRHTKTKRLKDVDIFSVFHDDERPKYRNGKAPAVVLDAVEKKLVQRYGRDKVKRQRRSVSVQFPTDPNDPEQVMSFDVVPAFEKGNHYEIPDEQAKSGWTETDPTIHAEKATAAHAAYGNEWKGMVRMIKRWNRERNKPVKPSFLLEVMALDILLPPWNSDYPYEIMSFFATAADRIFEEWPDPAGLGTPVSDGMTDTEKRDARVALQKAAGQVRLAINLSAAGQNGEAMRKYQELFGPLFSMT